MSLARKVLAHVTRNPIRYSIGGVLALVFGGVYLYRRRQAKQLAGADLGTAQTTMNTAVKRQVEAAKGHMPLSDFRQAESSSLFYGAPSDDSGAYYRAAFWLAVAARCSQVWSLADLADAHMQKGIAAQRAVFGVSTANRSSILLAAGQAITAAAPTNPGARAAAAALGSQSDPGKLATRDQINKDRSAAGKIKGTYEASKQDVTEYAEKALDVAGALSNGFRMLIGMDPAPGGPPDPLWNWKKWAIRGGVAAAVILGVRVMFAPEYHAAKAIVAKAGTAVQNPVAAIRAALTGPA
jgi:hypothetical protein